MEILKKKLEDFISIADKIIEANNPKEEELFASVKNPNAISEILDIPIQDPDKAYQLYYPNIQKFLKDVLPKKSDISSTIRSLTCVLLTHKELENIKSGKRGADSRMATTADMEHLIDVLSEWSTTPTDFYKLAYILFEKNKELGYLAEGRELKDYL